MAPSELAKKIFEVSYLTGTFKLRSGKTASEYFDKYRFESQPKLLEAIAEELKDKIPKNVDALAGLEMGGIPIATALSLKTGIPTVLVRKKAKDYGTCQFAEGLDVKGKNLLVIEDVITTGGQVVQSASDLRTQGANIQEVLCVIDRSQGKNLLGDNQLKLTSLFTMDELLAHK
ncbi:MAG: orotate phosphoribosyltransferase [Bdellovibrionales bacterium]|nr:orotate phosphoribosyltransferase [Bdellovibrionales bacterium]